MSELNGAVVLVIGASGGLGSRIARQLGEVGASVVRAGRNPATPPPCSAPTHFWQTYVPRAARCPSSRRRSQHTEDSTGRNPFVVTLSGVVAEAPTAGLAAYSASKAALAAFVSAASREYRRSGIRLLDARPGHTDTALSTHPVAGVVPAFGRALDPENVASRIVLAIIDGEKDLPSTAF